MVGMRWIWNRIYPDSEADRMLDRSERLRSVSSRQSLEGVTVEGAWTGKQAPSPLFLPKDKGTLHDKEIEDNSVEGQIAKLKEENATLWTIVNTHYVKASCETAGLLDRRMQEVWKATERANLSSVLFTSDPCSTAMSKPAFQRFVLFLCFLFFAMAIECTSRLATIDTGFKASGFKFVPTELRDGSTGDAIMSPSISSFGLTHDGCLIPTASASWRQEGKELHMNLTKAVFMNGFQVTTSRAVGPEKDPIRFILECQMEDGEWRQCGAAVHRYNMVIKLKFHNKAVVDLTDDRGATVSWDFRPTWHVWLNSPVRNLIMFTFFGLMWVVAQIGYPRWCKWLLITEWKLLSLLCFIIFIGYFHSNQMDTSAVWFSESIGNMIIPVVLLMNEALLIPALLLFGIYQTVVMTFVIKLVGFSYSDVMFTAVSGLIMIVIVVLFKLARHNMLHKSRRMISPDKRVYDEVWSCVVAADETVGALAKLQELVLEKQVELRERDSTRGNTVCRHLNRRLVFESAGNTAFGGGIGEAGTTDPKRPVSSLDQLYAQAVSVDIVLLRKVQEWAKEGLFPANPDGKTLHRVLSVGSQDAPPTPHFIKWEHAQRDESLRNSIKWGRIKRPERAVEKAVRTYKNDVSRLVDLVRQSIVFDSVEKLTDALKGVTGDPQVVVERIKNRLDPTYDTWASAGYRDVVLNLRVVTEETQKLGVETHVCELQLMLKEFAELKHEDGHARYVRFRNLRGE